MRRVVLIVVAVVAFVVAGCATSTSEPEGQSSSSTASSAAPGGPSLVNLGDSFSAAAGVQPLEADSPVMCFRSSRNFAHVLAAAQRYRLDDVSCSGADTSDFFTPQYEGVAPQLDALDADADVVTLMIGGNDSSVYTTAIGACSDVAASDPAGSPCRDAHGSQYVDIVRDSTYPALVRAFTAVRAKSPDARVLAVGYPWILPADTGCYPTMRVASGDVGYLRRLQAVLNDAIARAARRTGVDYVDMSRVSEGHDACAPVGQRWIEPQQGNSGASPVHPNAAGQQAIADQVAAALR
ncbi:SGNH/GDSL hydrolase family protein [Gordonia insulae]|uniref:Lipase 2 n=1 Tax=Gordonia insulae TaxID=2420509 RepID=A0A3G8JSY5_9ACTN|nr:SGNH/GDSL hydrolase family protein [Gordonia insulae]AZG48013.1 Lipase 2 [Gordonia insulae]